MPSMTIVEEGVGVPLGVVKRGVPRKGDNVWIGRNLYRVVSRDRDVIIVRKPGVHYADNASADANSSGYTKNFPIDKDRPMPQYRRGPVFEPPPRQYQQFPPIPPGWQWPQYGPAPTAEAAGQTKNFTVMHQDLRIPLFMLETAYIPKDGTIEIYGGEEFRFTGSVGDTIYVLPVRPWNYFAVAIDKETKKAIVFKGFTTKRERSAAKMKLKQRMIERGIPRKKYHLTYETPDRVIRFFENPSHLPRYRRTSDGGEGNDED